MSQHADLPALLVSGERSVFPGPPGAALEPLRAAIGVAREHGNAAAEMGSTYLPGVALVALGRFGAALDLLEPLAGSGAATPPGRAVRVIGRLHAR